MQQHLLSGAGTPRGSCPLAGLWWEQEPPKANSDRVFFAWQHVWMVCPGAGEGDATACEQGEAGHAGMQPAERRWGHGGDVQGRGVLAVQGLWGRADVQGPAGCAHAIVWGGLMFCCTRLVPCHTAPWRRETLTAAEKQALPSQEPESSWGGFSLSFPSLPVHHPAQAPRCHGVPGCPACWSWRLSLRATVRNNSTCATVLSISGTSDLQGLALPSTAVRAAWCPWSSPVAQHYRA